MRYSIIDENIMYIYICITTILLECQLAAYLFNPKNEECIALWVLFAIIYVLPRLCRWPSG